MNTSYIRIIIVQSIFHINHSLQVDWELCLRCASWPLLYSWLAGGWVAGYSKVHLVFCCQLHGFRLLLSLSAPMCLLPTVLRWSQMISKQGYLIWKGTLEKQKWHHWNQSKAMASCTKGWFVRHWHQCMMWMGRLVPFSRNAYGCMKPFIPLLLSTFVYSFKSQDRLIG